MSSGPFALAAQIEICTLQTLVNETVNVRRAIAATRIPVFTAITFTYRLRWLAHFRWIWQTFLPLLQIRTPHPNRNWSLFSFLQQSQRWQHVFLLINNDHLIFLICRITEKHKVLRKPVRLLKFLYGKLLTIAEIKCLTLHQNLKRFERVPNRMLGQHAVKIDDFSWQQGATFRWPGDKVVALHFVGIVQQAALENKEILVGRCHVSLVYLRFPMNSQKRMYFIYSWLFRKNWRAVKRRWGTSVVGLDGLTETRLAQRFNEKKCVAQSSANVSFVTRSEYEEQGKSQYVNVKKQTLSFTDISFIAKDESYSLLLREISETTSSHLFHATLVSFAFLYLKKRCNSD